MLSISFQINQLYFGKKNISNLGRHDGSAREDSWHAGLMNWTASLEFTVEKWEQSCSKNMHARTHTSYIHRVIIIHKNKIKTQQISFNTCKPQAKRKDHENIQISEYTAPQSGTKQVVNPVSSMYSHFFYFISYHQNACFYYAFHNCAVVVGLRCSGQNWAQVGEMQRCVGCSPWWWPRFNPQRGWRDSVQRDKFLWWPKSPATVVTQYCHLKRGIQQVTFS